MPSYYLAPALVRLRQELNTAHPRRDKTSDGWIGDTSHAARASDHNPDWDDGGVVRAFDADKDGIDTNELLRRVIADPRTNYVIWSGYIYSRAYGFAKRRYTGANGHYGHLHISIRHGRLYENDTRSWGYKAVAPKPAPAPAPTYQEDDVEFIEKGAPVSTVKLIQNCLINEAKKNGRPNPLPRFGADGDYGDETVAAIGNYQRIRGISTSKRGLTGGVTLAFLLEYRTI